MARKQVLNRAVEVKPDTMDTAPVGFVTVKALGWLVEDGITYKPGDVFKVTPERAAALGANVKAV
jgi:hypothetical protein